MTFDASKLKLIIVAVLALFAALYLGIAAATAQFETVAWVVGGLTLVACLIMGSRIWMLIPFMAALDLSLRIPGQPSTLLIAQLLVIAFSVIQFLTRKLHYKIRFSELEFLLILLILVVLQAYVRNPVGIRLFGTDTVGGRNYYLFGITCVTAFLLCFLRIPSMQLRAIFRISILGGFLNFVISVIGQFNSAVGFYTGTAFVTYSDQTNEAIDTQAAGRIPYLATASRNFSLWISSVVSPVAAILNPLWVILILIALGMSAMSGYRSASMVVILTFFIGTCYRGGRHQVFIGFFAAAAALTLLASWNAISPLPPNIQRSLTFLPGTWDERYKTDTAGSTDWRVEIWKEALLSERWISNKFLGDGLGFTTVELNAQVNYRLGTRAGTSGFDAQRDAILSSGDYHSATVSAVRTCGYLGLLVLIVVMFRLCVHAHRLIRICKGSRYHSLSLFLGIPPLVALISFPLAANTFLQVASASILSLSLIRFVQNNLALDPAPAVQEPTSPRNATAPRHFTLPTQA